MAASKPVVMAPCREFPDEIKEQSRAFHSALLNVKETLSPILAASQEVATEELSPLDKARLDLTLLYSLNSLFWMYLCTLGEDPKQHSVRQELDRVKEYMTRAKQIADKAKAPKLVAGAAQRFVRNALWTATDGGQKDDQEPPRKKRR